MQKTITRTVNYLGDPVKITLNIMPNEDHSKYIGEVYSQDEPEKTRAARAAKFDELCIDISPDVKKEDIYPAHKSSWMAQIFEDFSVVKN